jgi:tetratricopeptide (TPR) repeat protein
MIIYYDSDKLSGTFYVVTAHYYSEVKDDLPEAANMCNRAISLGISSGYITGQVQALRFLAWIEFLCGEHFKVQLYAQQSQRLARASGDLHGEAGAARMEAIFWHKLGHYKQSLLLCIRARNLLDLCGMTASEANLGITNIQAEVHNCKSEYSQALDIYTNMLQNVSVNQNAYWHAFTLVNVAETRLLMGAHKDLIQRNIYGARSIFGTFGFKTGAKACDATLAALYVREKDLLPAKLLLEKTLKLNPENQIESFCLEWLANVSQWGATHSTFRWTTVFLAHSIKNKKNLEVHKALQFFGDLFLTQEDEASAFSLFTVALQGFTYMDVHRSRAECMLKLGDISKSHGDLLKAMELWDTARPLFERSSQAQQMENIDCRLAGLGQEIQLQHRENLANLAQPNALSGTAEVEDDQADTEDLENMSDDKKRVADMVAV